MKPHQIFAAGDLSDPHDTHRLCLDAITAALQQVRRESWFKDCYVWFYRGAWEEWEIEQIDMAVPISPEELERKRSAIFKHQTQKDGTMLLGGDIREVWERTEERNRGTAKPLRRPGHGRVRGHRGLQALPALRLPAGMNAAPAYFFLSLDGAAASASSFSISG